MQLFKTDTQKAAYSIVYDLYPFTDKLYLPMAYIVSKDREGYLAHIKQRALPETISNFGLQSNADQTRLFEIIALLQPKKLEEKYNLNKRKKAIPLESLLDNRDIAPSIFKYIHQLLDELLQIAVKNNYYISWAVDRKVLVKDFILKTDNTPLFPRLYFLKEEKSVKYKLQLASDEEIIVIHNHDVVPVTNHPAWVVIDYKLYQVVAINGNMVKPFQKKEEVIIPEKSVKTYFQKFILKVAAKADIEAEGFDIIHDNTLQHCQLKAVQDIFNGSWVLSVKMVYPYATFDWNEKKDKNTKLEFDDGEEVRILQSVRDREQEAIYLKKLEGFALTPGTGSYFTLLTSHPSPSTPDILEWLINNKAQLEEAGFQVDQIEHEGKAILLHPAVLNLKSEQNNDWFDIYGQVVVGGISFPFMSLARNIREGNRFYNLPDGQVFLIPEEWMTRYKGLFDFAKKDNKGLKIAKSQYTLLKEVGLQQSEELTLPDTSNFQPSPLLKATLRPYQLEGVRWLVQLYQQELGACLADDMGLGKTLQTIALLLHAKEQKGQELNEGNDQAQGLQLGLFNAGDDLKTLKPLQALIVLPASLVFNWEAEIKKFAPSLQVYRHTGQKRYKDLRLIARFDVILTTYQTALRDVDLFKKILFEYIILDESQYIKNKDSKVFKALNELEANHKISLSGTPIENSLSDLWAQMQFINPGLLGSYTFFQRAFIRPIERGGDEEQKDQLRKLVAPYLLRRTKEQVAKDLPELTTKVFYTEMTAEQKRLYEREKSAARNYLLDNYKADDPKFRFQVLQSLTKLRQIANHPKLAVDSYEKESGKYNDIMAHWEVIRKGGHKVLVFSSFVKHLDLYRQTFEKQQIPYSWLTGSQQSKDREAAIKIFSDREDVQAFFISIKAGGAGLNLTAADYVFLLDPWWNPSTEQQAIARAHRIGQEKHVIAIKFISKDTIEEKILKLQQKKAKLAQDIIGDIQKASFTKGDLAYLFD